MESSDYQTLRQKLRPRIPKILATRATPISVEWDSPREPALIGFSDGSRSVGSCIRCINPPCMLYTEDELLLGLFSNFPADKNPEVCPTGAITWPQDSESPVVNTETCISCGICVGRCPVSAIWLSDDLVAVINDEPNDLFVLGTGVATQEYQDSLISLFSGISKRGIYIQENDYMVQLWYEKFLEISPKQSAQFPNHLVRNLLMTLGAYASMRRRGDVNIRMDIMFVQESTKIGTCEVELGSEVLEVLRSLLDNVAVLVSRYKYKLCNIIPLAVTLSLPNQRSEYWQVIKDIGHVLDIRINSLTVGMLVLMVWNRLTLSFDSRKVFYADSDTCTLRDRFESMLGRCLNISAGYLGFVESLK